MSRYGGPPTVRLRPPWRAAKAARAPAPAADAMLDLVVGRRHAESVAIVALAGNESIGNRPGGQQGERALLVVGLWLGQPITYTQKHRGHYDRVVEECRGGARRVAKSCDLNITNLNFSRGNCLHD